MYYKCVGWKTDQIFNGIVPIKLVLPPSSLEDEQMFLRVHEVFVLTNREREANVRKTEVDSHFAIAHQLLIGLYSASVSGKKSFTCCFVQ